MLFHEKVNFLINTLDISNAELSRATSLDASLISRFKSGDRTPTVKSLQIAKLCNGFALLANLSDKMDLLAKSCNLPLSLTVQELSKGVFEWINNEDSQLKPERNMQIEKIFPSKMSPLHSFNEKLNLLMSTLDVSNICLATYLNVNPTFISRLRNGINYVNIEDTMITAICNFFILRTKSNNERLTLLNILEISNNDISSNELAESLYSWLQLDIIYNPACIENFLGTINNPKEVYDDTTIPPTSSNVLVHRSQTFWGLDGARTATKLFVDTVLSSKNATYLNLYSDQKEGWLVTSTHEFNQTWICDMKKILKKGIRIRIIHNLNNQLPEIFNSILRWLPFYKYDQIESYYSKIAVASEFNHTIFLAENIASITSAALKCSVEKDAEYNLFTDSEHLEHLDSQFNSLLKLCTPLVEVYSAKEPIKFNTKIYKIYSTEGNLKLITPVPPLYTLPEDILVSILKRNNIQNDICKQILEFYNRRKQIFINSLENKYHTLEIINFSEYLEKVNLDIPIHILPTPIYYTKSELFKHFGNMKKYEKKYKNYKSVLVNNYKFENIKVIIKENVGALIINYETIPVAFLISHPSVYTALEQYINIFNNKKGKNISKKKYKTKRDI